jgi:hypothetical protein
MRNLLKISVLLLSLLPWNRSAQAQFQTAIISELNNPSATGYADRAQTINAYSYSNVMMDGGGVYTLDIHAWNSPDPTSVTGSGIAWNQINNAGTYNTNYLIPALTNKLSVDIVLTQTPQDSVCALLVYYEPGVGHFMDTYIWDETNNALTLRATDQLSTASNFGWIHIDANSLDSFVVTWEENTRIYARAGQSKNISGSYPELASGGKVLFNLPSPVQQPDVALSNAISTGQLMLHFTYLDLNDSVFEARDTFSNLYLYAGGTDVFQIEDAFFQKGANMPRIDCPDHADDDDWSYVVEGRSGTLTYILAGVQAYSVTPLPQHFYLSDGSLTGGGSPVLDLTMAKGQYYPVVAYDPQWKYIYYAWDLQDASILSPYGTVNAYIGFRMANDGSLATNRYWFLQTTPADASFFPGIALSGQNDATDSFYMAFTKFNPPATYYIGCKNVEWGSPTNSFKPGTTTGIKVLKGDALITAFPNPFQKGFGIHASDELANEIFDALLVDINGRVITTRKGDIPTLNKAFEKESLIPGAYILNLYAPTIFKQIKIIKQ